MGVLVRGQGLDRGRGRGGQGGCLRGGLIFNHDDLRCLESDIMDHFHRDAFAHQVNETRVVEGGEEERGGVTTVDGHFC